MAERNRYVRPSLNEKGLIDIKNGRHPVVEMMTSHDMFIANVVNVLADSKYINKETNSFELEKANLLAYSHGKYYSLGKRLGFFGYSVQKKKKKKKWFIVYSECGIVI